VTLLPKVSGHETGHRCAAIQNTFKIHLSIHFNSRVNNFFKW